MYTKTNGVRNFLKKKKRIKMTKERRNPIKEFYYSFKLVSSMKKAILELTNPSSRSLEDYEAEQEKNHRINHFGE